MTRVNATLTIKQQIDEMLLEGPQALTEIVEAITDSSEKIPAIVVVPHYLLSWQEAQELHERLADFCDNNSLDEACLRSLEKVSASQGYPITVKAE